MSIPFSIPAPTPRPLPPAPTIRFEEQPQSEELANKQQELEAWAKALEEQARELEADRVLWYERRREMENELRAARDRPIQPDPALIAEVRAQN